MFGSSMITGQEERGEWGLVNLKTRPLDFVVEFRLGIYQFTGGSCPLSPFFIRYFYVLLC